MLVASEMLQPALAYARMGWKVFPLHTIVDGRCSCARSSDVICSVKPPAPGKHPRVKGGFKVATTDQDQIHRWWQKWPNSNIGVATGDGVVVVDVDGAIGAAELKAVVEANQALPATLVAQTGSGLHLVFAERPGAPQLRSAARDHVHVRAAGGYICAPPSRHFNGRNYQWIKKVPLAVLPDWLRQWLSGYEISGNRNAVVRSDGTSASLGVRPSYLDNKQNQKDIGRSLQESLSAQYSPSEEARLASALQAIPIKVGYDEFLRIGMALKDLDWERPDGTSIAFDLWDAWCAQSEHYNQAGLEAKWRSFRRSGIAIGTVYRLANAHGWSGGAPKPLLASLEPDKPVHLNGHANGHANGAQALPAAFLASQEGAIFFPDRTEEGKIKSTMTNAKVGVGALGVDCRADLFHNRILVAGELVGRWASKELSDPIVTMLRDHIRFRFGFDPGKQQVQDACETLALNRMFDPVLDYLDSLIWDGVPRLDTWLCRYMQAQDTDYTRAVSRLSLIAAVRRARRPGTKFDQIIVLEGSEGRGKSEALEILAGPENFSDQSILGVDDRKQQEMTEGVWIYEIGELTGMRRADVENVKAFASRKTDRARPAYGRYKIWQPRRTIFFASTNRTDYLQSDTGNRRFWPIATGRIDLETLARDRDQIWAEANRREVAGESHFLPEALWPAASEQQEARMQSDDWLELIERYVTEKKLDNVNATQVLCDNQYIQRRPDAVTSADNRRVAAIMKKLGWDHRRMRTGSSNCPVSRYVRRS